MLFCPFFLINYEDFGPFIKNIAIVKILEEFYRSYFSHFEKAKKHMWNAQKALKTLWL